VLQFANLVLIHSFIHSFRPFL